MKKTLFAATLAATVSGALAADVTLYGVADVGLRYTNTKTDGVSTDKLEMMSGHNAGSRFGLKGSEDLGNGWKAGFQLEGQYLVDTGALKNAKFFHRQATVSISGPLGTVYAGRMGTLSSAAGPADLIFAAGDAFDGGDNLIYALSVESRRDNTLLYVTPAAGGLQGYLQYSFQGSGQENVQSSLNERYMGAGLRWKAGAFESALAVEHVRYAAAADDVKGALDDKLAVSLAANYDFGVTKLFGTAQWVLGGEVLKRNTPYRDGSIPLVQYTGEGGYYYNIFSSPNKTVFLSIGGSAMLGYESVNGGKRLLYDGATLGQC